MKLLRALWAKMTTPPGMNVKCHVCEVWIDGPADMIHETVRDHLNSPEHRLAEWEREVL